MTTKKAQGTILITLFSFLLLFIYFVITYNKNTTNIQTAEVSHQTPIPDVILFNEELYSKSSKPPIHVTNKYEINYEIEKEFNLPNGLLFSVHLTETSGRCKVVSNAGAKGCFQIMPTTEKYIEEKFNIVINPTDYKSSAKGSAMYLTYLKEKIEKYYPELNNEVQWGLALASYNAGATYGLRWAKIIDELNVKTITEASEFITYDETRNYMKTIGEAVFGIKYTVEYGDTLYSISKKANVNLDTLLASLGTSNIIPGQIIKVN